MSTVLSRESALHTSKWGTLMILNADNYGQWRQNIRTAFAAVDTWNIVQGVELAPGPNAAAALRNDYKRRLDISLQILNSVIPADIGVRTNAAMLARDPTDA